MWSNPASASSAAIRSSSVSPMPTRIPLVNGIFSSPAARIVVEPRLGVLGRRALVGDEVGVDRLQHQPLRGGHLAQAGQVLLRQDAEVGVREQPALERPLADPGDVGGEVGVPELGQLRGDARVVVGRLAGQDQQLLDVAARGAVEDPLDLVGLVQVRLVRRERAVLAVAPARPGERQREVARESDPSAHPAPSYAARVRMRLLLLALVLVLGGCGGGGESERPERAGHAAARLHAQRGPRRDLRRHRPRLRHRRGRPARDPQARRLDRRAEAAAERRRPTWRSSTSTTSGWRARRGATWSA